MSSDYVSLYKSIDISTRHSSNPITFIKALIITYRPSTIYLADLDSLDGDGNNIDIICRIANMFRNKIFWVDVGAQKIKKLKIFQLHYFYEKILCVKAQVDFFQHF